MTKKEMILEALEAMTENDLISLNCEYISVTNKYDDEIYTLDDLDTIAEGQDAYWLLCRAYYGDFNPTIDYFKFDGYANLQSIRGCELLTYIDCEDIAEYCIDNDNDLYNDEIREILDCEESEDKYQWLN